MLEQELAMAHETIEDADNYESVVDAIQIEWIEQALLETKTTSASRSASCLVSYLDGAATQHVYQRGMQFIRHCASA